ncbi:MAG: cytochrome c-type biogenesis protein [Chloroflexota bacterium]
MRRRLGWIAIAWLVLVCAVALLAYGNASAQTSLDQRTQQLAGQLKCPVCQGESVADSQSDISKAIRGLIRKDLASGESPATITSFLLARYPNISLAPSTSGIGSIAWIAPPLLLLGGLGLLATLVIDWRTRGGSAPSTNALYLERVRAELADVEVSPDE